MKKRSGLFKFFSLAVAGGLALSLGGCLDGESRATEKKMAVRPVKVVQLTRTEHMQSLKFPATAKAARDVKLSFRVNGPLVTMDMETGQKVQKNQLIAAIDSRDFTIAIKTLEAKLAASKAQLEEATLQYKRYSKMIF